MSSVALIISLSALLWLSNYKFTVFTESLLSELEESLKGVTFTRQGRSKEMVALQEMLDPLF